MKTTCLRRTSWRGRARHGMALLMVIISIALMTVLVSDFMENTTVFVSTGANARDEIKATYLARSAINLSRLLLVVQPSINRMIRTFNMPPLAVWKYADMMLAVFSEPGAASGLGMLVGASLGDAQGMGVEGGSFSATIVDEDSRINLNLAAQGRMADALAQQLAGLMAPAHYNELFEERDERGDYTDRQTQIQAIMDWADRDVLPYGFDSGTEDSYYDMLTPRYRRRNAPFDSLEELRMVRGVDEDFWSAFVEPTDDPEQRLLTVWGSGRINVNTAPEGVLAALICTYAQLEGAEPACDPRAPYPPALLLAGLLKLGSAASLFPGVAAFSRPEDFIQRVRDGIPAIGIAGVPLNERLVRRYLAVESDIFSVYATGEAGRVRKTIHVVIHTGQSPNEGGAVLYWRED